HARPASGPAGGPGVAEQLLLVRARPPPPRRLAPAGAQRGHPARGQGAGRRPLTVSTNAENSAIVLGVGGQRPADSARGYGAVGSALPWHGRGLGFESP